MEHAGKMIIACGRNLSGAIYWTAKTVGKTLRIVFPAATKRWLAGIHLETVYPLGGNFTISWTTDQPLICDSSSSYHHHATVRSVKIIVIFSILPTG